MGSTAVVLTIFNDSKYSANAVDLLYSQNVIKHFEPKEDTRQLSCNTGTYGTHNVMALMRYTKSKKLSHILPFINQGICHL